MEQVLSLTVSIIFIAVISFSVWFFLTLSERSEGVDE